MISIKTLQCSTCYYVVNTLLSGSHKAHICSVQEKRHVKVGDAQTFGCTQILLYIFVDILQCRS